MTQAQIDNRFTLLCHELDATLKHGKYGRVNAEHVVRIKFGLLEKLHAAREANRRGRPLTANQVDELCDRFTDITGIDIPE
ncbi:hypothetical protein GCM10027169_13020 [Gordonia jinhuaensis]|uniref:Uncharacterized protein n=1 Tax=Gordonia jinhuaensis TaxID=1517702 RepID=A0A916WR24_9ACTN|nr:hypothetical protein [Gordonia jinhuaensis]GGB22491.1 hypothetical protein GCM10011489_08360 [Gordonia jinhuaensis]